MAKGKDSLTQTTVQRKREEVSVDFVEMDEIRLFVRKWRKDYIKKTKGAKRYGTRAYESASFYIGRRVTHLRLRDIRLPYFGIVRLAKAIEEQFGEYHAYYGYTDIWIYFRGIPRGEKKRSKR